MCPGDSNWGDWDLSGSYWTDCLSPAAGGLHLAGMYIYSHLWASVLLSQSREQDEAGGAVNVDVSVLCVFL